jgi:hypothetical protein
LDVGIDNDNIHGRQGHHGCAFSGVLQDKEVLSHPHQATPQIAGRPAHSDHHCGASFGQVDEHTGEGGGVGSLLAQPTFSGPLGRRAGCPLCRSPARE